MYVSTLCHSSCALDGNCAIILIRDDLILGKKKKLKKASQNDFRQAFAQSYKAKVRPQVFLSLLSFIVSEIHFHKLVKSPEYTGAGLKSRNLKIPHQRHFHPQQKPSDPSDTSGSNNPGGLHYRKFLCKLHRAVQLRQGQRRARRGLALSSLARRTKAGGSDKRETQINCGTDL